MIYIYIYRNENFRTACFIIYSFNQLFIKSHTAQNIAVILRQYCNVAAMLQQNINNIAAIFCAVWEYIKLVS